MTDSNAHRTSWEWILSYVCVVGDSLLSTCTAERGVQLFRCLLTHHILDLKSLSRKSKWTHTFLESPTFLSWVIQIASQYFGKDRLSSSATQPSVVDLRVRLSVSITSFHVAAGLLLPRCLSRTEFYPPPDTAVIVI
jgi:hypothetical protein